MKKWLYSIVAVPFLLIGCGEENLEVETLENAVMPVEVIVEIQTAEQLNIGENKLAARVTQSDVAVNDADEVKFEVWESGLRYKGEMPTTMSLHLMSLLKEPAVPILTRFSQP